MDIKKLIGSKIRELRIKRSLTQEELAHRSDLHTTFIAHIESGRKVCSVKSLQKIASALNIPVFVLLQTDRIPSVTKYDPHTEKLLSLIRDKSDADKQFLISIASSLFERDKKIYKK